ncbi:MAG TPA: hypothetical protein VHG51_10405 [Longimicrobiaceae bacterium]|nr:hypothetical protein [Longimicrobiaceae bacterium]
MLWAGAAAATLLVQLWLRPYARTGEVPGGWVLGAAPSLLLAFGAPWIGLRTVGDVRPGWFAFRCAVVAAVVVAEELLQPWRPGRTPDPLDMAGALAGAAASWLTYAALGGAVPRGATAARDQGEEAAVTELQGSAGARVSRDP